MTSEREPERPGYEDPAIERFQRTHPVHIKPGTPEPYAQRAFKSPTTNHVSVQCGCGYMLRYTLASLVDLPQEGETRRRSIAHG